MEREVALAAARVEDRRDPWTSPASSTQRAVEPVGLSGGRFASVVDVELAGELRHGTRARGPRRGSAGRTPWPGMHGTVSHGRVGATREVAATFG